MFESIFSGNVMAEVSILIVAAVLFIFITFLFIIQRYKVIPSDKIMVIFGKVGKGRLLSVSTAVLDLCGL